MKNHCSLKNIAMQPEKGFIPNLSELASETPYIRRSVAWTPLNRLTVAVKEASGLPVELLRGIGTITTTYPSGETSYELRSVS